MVGPILMSAGPAESSVFKAPPHSLWPRMDHGGPSNPVLTHARVVHWIASLYYIYTNNEQNYFSIEKKIYSTMEKKAH